MTFKTKKENSGERLWALKHLLDEYMTSYERLHTNDIHNYNIWHHYDFEIDIWKHVEQLMEKLNDTSKPLG